MKKMLLVGLLSTAAFATVLACSDDAASDDPSAAKADSGSDKDSATSADTATVNTTDAATAKETSVSDSAAATDTGPDAAPSKACDDYCTCMDAIKPCSDVFGGKGACLTACATQTKWDLACRATHCGLATAAKGAERTSHCGHAEGVGLCVDKP